MQRAHNFQFDIGEFRKVAVEWSRSPMFGNLFGDLVVVERYLKFGRQDSPEFGVFVCSGR